MLTMMPVIPRLIICGFLIVFLLPLRAALAQDVLKINRLETDAGVSITAKNLIPAPAVLRFTTTGRNIKSNCLQTCVIDVAPGEQIVVDQISPVSINKNWQYKTQYISHIGTRIADYDADYMYWPAFEHGKKFYLSQGFNGNFSHQGINAIDFSLPKGTPVHAARSGLVIWVEQKFKGGGLSETFKDKANYISIQHDDGTQATYAHLQHNGSVVKPGNYVVKGQHIGFSGQTGFGRGPHLHFEVARITPQGMYESLPFKIRSRHGRSEFPESGFYYAVNTTKPAIKEVYADEIDFSGYFEKDPVVDIKKVKDRQLKIDDHVLIYIQNGKAKAIDVELNIKLSGYVSLRTIPANIVVNPGTEKLIAVVHPKPGVQSSRFTYSYKYRELH